MFQNISKAMADRMRFLEERDAEQRIAGLPPSQRLCQIPPETGKFIALLAAAAPFGKCLEIGTSGGYSTLWLSLACCEKGEKITTFELHKDRAEWARETYKRAHVEPQIELIVGDARQFLENYKDIAFCFLDAEKGEYEECYEEIIPRMVGGGFLVGDNILSHREVLAPFVEKVLSDGRVDAVVVPIGKGVLVCRKR